MRSPPRSRRARKVIEVTHITNLTGQILPIREDRRDGAAEGDRGVRRRRARLRALPVQARRARRATTTRPACTSGCYAPIGTGFLYVRKDKIEGALAADGGQRQRRTTTSASTRRSARIRRRTSTRSAAAIVFHRGIGVRSQDRAPALAARPLGEAPAGRGQRAREGADAARFTERRRHRLLQRRRDRSGEAGRLALLASTAS